MTNLHGSDDISATGADGRLEGSPGHQESGVPVTRRLAGAVLLVLTVVVILCLPAPYVVETPGPTQDVLGRSGSSEVITVTGGRTYKDRGSLLLTTVNARGIPGYPVSNFDALVGWMDPDSTVLPREAVVPPGQTVKEYKEENKKDMTGSQDMASRQALSFLRSHGHQVEGVSLSMHVDDIGGPSAGLMYTLGAIDKLTPQEETGGRTIAGTGTIDQEGKVGPIGGIQLKMLGARRDGAGWFLAPKSNCKQVVGHVPSGLREVKVSTLDEAYAALTAIGKGEGGSLPRCTAGD